MIQRHPIEPAIMDLRRAHNDLATLQPERLQRLMGFIEAQWADGYPTRHIGADPESGGSYVVRFDHTGAVIPPEETLDLTSVEAAALHNDPINRARADIEDASKALALAVSTLLAKVLYNERLWAPHDKPKVERCCGGWGDTQQADCTDAAGHWPIKGGVTYACCSRCYQRSSKAERRESARTVTPGPYGVLLHVVGEDG